MIAAIVNRSTPAALLEIDAVSKRYAARTVLAGVSVALRPGEAVGLVGINGAGKTTLIRGLLGLKQIDSGTISIDGVAHTSTASRQAVAYLAERFQPPPFASGNEILRHLLALHGKPFDGLEVAREAAALELDSEALQRPGREYSKGMAQKLGLIACILTRCPLLLLDEPMSGLDPKARALVKRRLGALKARGTGLFFSTHLLVDVESLCDRIAILHGGRIVFDDTPPTLLARTGCATLEAAFLALIEAGA